MSDINELLYMARMNDETAIRLLMEEVKPQIRYSVREILNSYRPLKYYEEDFMQEAVICVHKAMETFRDDMNCSFSSYLALIVKRRLWALARKLSRSLSQGFNHTIALDCQYADEESLINVIENRDAMSNPEYYLRYTLARDSLRALCRTFNERENVIYDAWERGEKQTVSSRRLGLTYKQFEGRLRRLRNRVREVVYSA